MGRSLADEDLTSVPAAQSTPKRSQDFRCSYCNKSYRRKFFFDQHLKTHSVQGSANVSFGDATQDTLNLSDASLTTFKKPPNRSIGKKKVAGRIQKKKSFVCTYCLKAYVSEKVMRKHQWTHTMQVAASRFPDAGAIVSNAAEIGQDVMAKVANCISFGPSGQVFKQLVAHVACLENFNAFSAMVVEEIVSVVENKKCLLPSTLMKALFNKKEEVLNDNLFCAKCCTALDISHFEEYVQSQFLLEFLMLLTSDIFHFITKSFRDHFPRAVRAMPELDVEDRQVVYYIAGSIIRGYLRLSFRYKNCVQWKTICSVLKTHVLCSTPVGDIDAEWTRKLDRGGLLYINADCQTFFISLTKLIYQNEKKDGSLEYNLIIKLVTESNTSVLWDNVLKDSLPEDVSVNLMNDVVSAFCKACGRGIARKKLNALRDKPVISMPTRHAVASRKK